LCGFIDVPVGYLGAKRISSVNLVFVNQVCPNVPHIGGTRSWKFATALAARGHRVVQISEQWGYCREVVPLAHLPSVLNSHDWAGPLLVPVEPASDPIVDRVKSRNTPAVARKALVLWSYLLRSGVRTHFSAASHPYAQLLAAEFRPDVVWGLFGNTDCWLTAQRLARLSGCPWVADMKDSWDVFLPSVIRRIISSRFQDMAACTCNAEFNAESCKRWFMSSPTVVYSGVDECFLEACPVRLEGVAPRITLTGGLYDQAALARFVGAVGNWARSAETQHELAHVRPVVYYAGSNSDLAQHALRVLSPTCDVEVHGYLPLHELAELCRSATINAYIRSPRTFHHKLLELLACGRPVIAFPGETDESRRLAAQCGGRLECPSDPDELETTLRRVMGDSLTSTSIQPDMARFTWAAQAQALERVLVRVASGSVH
jgi:glycosyltransferase involved in cell wall biosynthesis